MAKKKRTIKYESWIRGITFKPGGVMYPIRYLKYRIPKSYWVRLREKLSLADSKSPRGV